MTARTIRLFLSSTFRDFGEERDLLVKRVFPALRARLRDRFVELVDVDLRWGITAEEAERGEVLPICLAEIDRARPYFIGMLGERYGWIPPPDGYAADLLERQPWLKKHQGGKSVTELEILHGVLNNRRMQGRAFFYFRSPAYARTKGGDYLPSVEDHARQTELKRRIRERGLPVASYINPEALAKRIERDLWKLLDAEFPATSVPDAFERERMRHDAYAALRRRLYLGGERYQAALAKLLEAEEPRIVVKGASGGGKSALLANFLDAYRKRRPRHLMHEHYLGASADAADPHALVRRLIEFIQRTTQSREEIPGDPQQLMDSLPIWLATASGWARRRRTRFIFVLDSLNSLTEQQDLRWWPAFLPRGITMLVSCLPGPVHDALKGKTDALPKQDQAAKWKTVTVRPLTKAQSATLLNTYLARFNKKLPRQMVKQVQAHPLATNPLFLRTLAEELRLFGVHEELQKRLDHYLSSQTIDDLFERVLERVEKDCGKKQVKAAMTAIWASRAGLTEKEILGIANLKPVTWASIRNALNDALLEANGRITFSHDYVRIGVRDRYLVVKATRRRVHRELARWFKVRPADARRAEEEPYQWQAAEEWDELRGAMTRGDMFSVLISHRGQQELLAYWLALENHKLFRIEQSYQQAWPTMQRRAPNGGARLLGQLRDFLFFGGCYGNFVLRITRQRVVEFRRRKDRVGDLVESLNDLAALLFERSEFRAARDAYDEAITLIEKHPGVVSPDDEILYRSNHLCLMGEMDDRRQAIASCRDLIALIESAPRKFREAKEHLATLRNQIGCNLTDLGDLASAEHDIRIALKLNLESSGPINVDRSVYLNNLAASISAQGRDQDALTALVEARKISHQILGSEHRDTRIRTVNLAESYRNFGDLAKAQVVLDELPPRETAVPNDQTLFSEMNTRALILRDLGRHREAIAQFLSLLDVQRATFGNDHSSVALTLHNIAAVKADQGDLRGAIKSIEASLLTFESNGLLTYCASASENLAAYYEDLNEPAAAINALRRALSFLESVHGVCCPQSMDVRYRLGNLIFEAGDHNDGLDLLTQELEIANFASGKDSESVFRSLLNLGEKYYSIDGLEKGVSVHRRALRLAQILHGKVSWETSVCAHRLAICLKETGRTTEARNFVRLENEIDALLARSK